MKCPFCKHKNDKVIDSRMSSDGISIRRRRECLKCNRRFTTHEYIEKDSLLVVKKDGRREQFDNKKILSGIIKACEKRPISLEKMEEAAAEIERLIHKNFDREINSRDIGEFVITKLARLDDVAYVRFASVYRQFKDVNQFMQELKTMFKKGKD
ncbi:transcriptional regulator NrdR [Thermoproteota archaeon]